jgi:hypothetical protein
MWAPWRLITLWDSTTCYGIDLLFIYPYFCEERRCSVGEIRSSLLSVAPTQPLSESQPKLCKNWRETSAKNKESDLVIYCLFNDAAGSQTVWCRIVAWWMNDDLEGTYRCIIKVPSQNWSRGAEENHGKCRDDECTGWEYEYKVLGLALALSDPVCVFTVNSLESLLSRRPTSMAFRVLP